MRIGIVDGSTLAKEGRLDAKHYLGASARAELRVCRTREAVRVAIRRYRQAQAAAKEAAVTVARLANDIEIIG